MDKRLYGNYGAKAAIEMALFDIMGKHFWVPLYDLLGGRVREKLPLSRSASQSDIEKDGKRTATNVSRAHKQHITYLTGHCRLCLKWGPATLVFE